MDEASMRAEAHRLALQVAIDGPAGAGKSTVGRGVAEKLDAAFLDTGLMYRAVTWLALAAGVGPADAGALSRIAQDSTFSSTTDASSLLVNGCARDRELRTEAVDNVVSEVSTHPGVRMALVAKQREFARARCVVMVGRDIGTTVLPDAPVKLWVTASPEERARRRLREGLAGNSGVTLEQMAYRIRTRDEIDESRSLSPLRRAPNAHNLDTDGMNQRQVVEQAMDIVRRTIEAAQ
jgi:cytidylate kinase